MDDITSAVSMLSSSMQQQSLGGQIIGKTLDGMNQGGNQGNNISSNADFQKEVLSDAMGVETSGKGGQVDLTA